MFFHHVQTQGRHELNTLKVEDPVPHVDSISTLSDINTYTDAMMDGALLLLFLSDSHLVSSSMRQSHNPGFAEQHLTVVSDFMSDLEPNIRIRDRNNHQLHLELVPNEYTQFSIEKVYIEWE